MNAASQTIATYEYFFDKYIRKILEDDAKKPSLLRIVKDRNPGDNYHHRRFTPAQKGEMIRLRNSFVKTKQIALQFGCSVTTIARVVGKQLERKP